MPCLGIFCAHYFSLSRFSNLVCECIFWPLSYFSEDCQQQRSSHYKDFGISLWRSYIQPSYLPKQCLGTCHGIKHVVIGPFYKFHFLHGGCSHVRSLTCKIVFQTRHVLSDVLSISSIFCNYFGFLASTIFYICIISRLPFIFLLSCRHRYRQCPVLGARLYYFAR